MATTRFWKIGANLGYVLDYVSNPEKTSEENAGYVEDLKKVLHYASNPEKTEQQMYVTGVNCSHMTAFEEMSITKEQWQKKDGPLAWHGYMSFKPGEVTPEQAHKIGIEFAEKNFPGFQVVVATHLNTGVVHNHFVVNSVSSLDGHRAHDEVTWFKFRKLADEIVKSHSLSVIKKPHRTKEPTLIQNRIRDYYQRTDEPLIREAVDRTLAVSTNMLQFKKELSAMGYNYNLAPNRKYWTVSPKGSRAFRLYHLGEEYTNAAIMERLAGNQKPVMARTVTAAVNTVKVKRVVFKRYHGTGSTILRLYRHYMYVLGKIDSNREETLYLPHNVRKDTAKLTDISEEARFLENAGISMADELIRHKDLIGSDMAELIARRKVLRNEMRRKGCDTDAVRKEAAKISGSIEKIRKELRMCDNIMKRSGIISDNIAAMELQSERSIENERRSRNSGPDCGRDSKDSH